MTPERINEVLATWRGWKLHGWEHRQMPYWESPENVLGLGPPDFYRDLNAVHELEARLFPTKVWELSDPDRWKEYRETLAHIAYREPGGAIRATAAQRCEALLKTLNLWEETKT